MSRTDDFREFVDSRGKGIVGRSCSGVDFEYVDTLIYKQVNLKFCELKKYRDC